MTFRRLRAHAAGIGEIPRLADVIHPAAFGMDKPGSRGADLASLYHGALRPEVPAGTKWACADHGFAVAGQLVRDISGAPLRSTFVSTCSARVMKPGVPDSYAALGLLHSQRK